MQLNRRHFLGALGAATAASAATLPLVLPGSANAQTPEANKDFRVVEPAQPTDAAGKIEVIEFMWYGCPHCYAFEPALTNWLKKLPQDVAFRRLPAQFSPIWVQHAKLFYTLDALGEEDRLHKKAFDAIHRENTPLDKDADQADWAAKNGIDKAKFVDAMKSFGVAGKLRRAAQVVVNYRIDGVPAMAVNGKYLTAPSMARGEEKCLQVVDYLIDAERKKKRA